MDVVELLRKQGMKWVERASRVVFGICPSCGGELYFEKVEFPVEYPDLGYGYVCGGCMKIYIRAEE